MDAVHTNGIKDISSQEDGTNLPKNDSDDRFRRYFSQVFISYLEKDPF